MSKVKLLCARSAGNANDAQASRGGWASEAVDLSMLEAATAG
jgi:hypothetical protein